MIKKLQNVNEEKLKIIQKYRYKILNNSKWDIFCKKIFKHIEETKKIKKIKNNKKLEYEVFESFKSSTHYHLNFSNVIKFIKSNLKYYMIKY